MNNSWVKVTGASIVGVCNSEVHVYEGGRDMCDKEGVGAAVLHTKTKCTKAREHFRTRARAQMGPRGRAWGEGALCACHSPLQPASSRSTYLVAPNHSHAGKKGV